MRFIESDNIQKKGRYMLIKTSPAVLEMFFIIHTNQVGQSSTYVPNIQMIDLDRACWNRLLA